MTKLNNPTHKNNPNTSLKEMCQALEKRKNSLFGNPLEALGYYNDLACFQSNFNYDLQYIEEHKINGMVQRIEELREYFLELHFYYLAGGHNLDVDNFKESD